MKQLINSPFKKKVAFFLLYFVLMASLIFAAVSVPINSNENVPSVKPELSNSFKEEMRIHEEKVRQKEIENAGKWEPSKQFVITAIVLASISDIVIILLWARHENKKREGSVQTRNRLTDSKWFWNIVAMGIVQPKNNRIVINWKNLIIFVIVMYLLKKVLFEKWWSEDSSSMTFNGIQRVLF